MSLTVTFNGEEFACEKAVKWTDYIHLVDVYGEVVHVWEGITDFSLFSISGGDWSDPPPVVETTATSAVQQGGNIALSINEPVGTGTIVKFASPCGSDSVTGGIIIDGVTYTVIDTVGVVATGEAGIWATGAIVSIVVNKDERKAYVQNGPIAKVAKDLSDHMEDKNNPHGVTPGQIGAVPKTGGTMTGVLTLESAGYPDLIIHNLTGNSMGKVRHTGNSTQILSISGMDTSNFRDLRINNAISAPAIHNAIQFYDVVNGVSTAYKIYGEHFKPTAADVGASPTGHKHAAGDVNSGTFAAARIPSLAISKITNLQNTLNGKADKAAPTEIPLPVSGDSTGGNLYYAKTQEALCLLRGVLAGNFANNSVIGTLPAGYRPKNAYTGVAFLTKSGGTAVCTYEVLPAGTIQLRNVQGTYQYVTLCTGVFVTA